MGTFLRHSVGGIQRRTVDRKSAQYIFLENVLCDLDLWTILLNINQLSVLSVSR